MARLVNRGFVVTLLAIAIVTELALRAAVAAPPAVVRVVYGTTLSMYLEVEARLRAAAPGVQVLALGDSLAMTQFQPDTFAADRGLPADAVFNAAYLAQTFRSQEMLLRHIGLDRLPKLKQVLVFVNPRRLTVEGNVDAPVFRVAIADPDGPWHAVRTEKSPSPILDYSRLYGLSRYLVTAAWRQVGRADSWDEVEYLSPRGGLVFERPRPEGDRPVFFYPHVDALSEEYITDLTRVIELFRARQVSVVLLPAGHHVSIDPFANAAAASRFNERMQAVSSATGATWLPNAGAGFEPSDDRDFLDYGHLNREGGIAFTHVLRDAIPPTP
jgi:hypothetical protein